MAFGQPIAHTALRPGTPVLDTDGIEFGRVQHVLQDDGLDLFDGVVISTNRELKFLDAAQITGNYPDAVLTTLSKDMVGTLSEPDGAPVYTVDFLLDAGDDSPTARLGRLLRREHWKPAQS